MENLRDKKVHLIEILSADSSFVLQFVQQKEIITGREYSNLKHPNHTQEDIIINLLDKVMKKGDGKCLDFLNLLKHEKLLEEFPKLKELFAVANQQESADKPFHQDNEYKMSSIPRGVCVIINNRDFKESKAVKLKYRKGSDADEDSLNKVFNWLGFTVKVYKDQKAEEMKATLNVFSQNNHEGDCFVCCILSHGCEEGVYGVDGGVVPSEDIFGPFRGTSCPSLAGKPKAFFIQACRGEDYQLEVKVEADGVEADGAEEEDEEGDLEMDLVQITIPDDGDFFVARSTVKGFLSVRSVFHGSWFIQSLCNQLARNCPQCEDIKDILTRVNREVGRRVAKLKIKDELVNVKQMPVQDVTLRKKLVFRVPSKSTAPYKKFWCF